MRSAVRAFTLIELLVAVAIIALLIAILLPALSSSRAIAARSTCAANLNGIGRAVTIYASEFDGSMPVNHMGAIPNNTSANSGSWRNIYLFNPNWDAATITSIMPARTLWASTGQMKLFVCPGPGNVVQPFRMNNPSTGAPFWNPDTLSLVNDVNGVRTRVASSYWLWFGDRGVVGRTTSTNPTGYTPRFWTDAYNGAVPWEAHPYFRIKLKDYFPNDVWAQDMLNENLDASNLPILAQGMHERTATARRDGGPRPGSGSDVEYWPSVLLGNSQADFAGQNMLRADGSVAFERTGDLQPVFTNYGGANRMWLSKDINKR